MPTQTYPYLALTDGTTTITIADGLGGVTNYPLRRGSYRPPTTMRRRTQTSGQRLYDDDVHELAITIRDTTPAGAYTRLRTLRSLLGRAEWWAAGVPGVAPVLLQIAPQGSTVSATATPLQTIVLGRARGDESSTIDLPESWSDAGMLAEIGPIRLRLRTVGGLYGAAESASSALATASSTVHEMLFPTAQPYDCPVKLQIGGITKGVTMPASVLLVSDQASTNGLRINEAEASTATNYTAIADTVTNTIPSGGQILRFAPGVAGSEILSGAIALPTKPGIIAIYAVLRSLNPSVVWSITPVMTYGLTAITVRGRTTVIDGSYYLTPQVVYLGTVTYLGNASDETLKLAIKASTTVGANLDFDVFGLLNLSYGTSTAIQINGGWETSVGHSHILDDATLTRPRPAISMASASNVSPWPAYGPLPIVSGICTPESPVAGRIRAAWLAPLDGQWRLGLAPTVFSTTMTATRLPVYPTPE